MLRITNPATDEIIREVPSDKDVSLKYQRARRAQPQWAKTPNRFEFIEKFSHELDARKDELALILTTEMGKPIRQARKEIEAVRGRIEYFVNESPRILAPKEIWNEDGMIERITWEALGVIANISAWNYPYFVGLNVIVPALLAGNTVLYKPSEHATLTGLAIVDALHRAGIPDDVIIPVIGAGDVGANLAHQPVDGLFFTGSYATGMKLLEETQKRMMRLQLELGGKDPAYVCADADLARAVECVADGAFYNTGQSCCAVERIYVEDRVHDELVTKVVEWVGRLKVGDPKIEETDLGPVARPQQLVLLEAQVKDAVERGGRVRCGGKRMNRRGYFFEPTVIDNCRPDMRVMREESFGPIIGIQSVIDDEEAIRLMNDTEYGLTASVHTSNEARAREILSRVETATSYWNCCDRVSVRLPWSGRKNSGIGVTLGHSGIEAFAHQRAWHLKA